MEVTEIPVFRAVQSSHLEAFTMPSKQTIRTLLACAGWASAGTFTGAVTGIVLFVVMMMLSKSEAIGQGMFLVIAWMILIPVGACIGFTRALVTWEKRNTISVDSGSSLARES
jgi:hypothetical protein